MGYLYEFVVEISNILGYLYEFVVEFSNDTSMSLWLNFLIFYIQIFLVDEGQNLYLYEFVVEFSNNLNLNVYF